MANEHAAFWLVLLEQGHDTDQRARLWNSYFSGTATSAGIPRQMKEERESQSGWPKLTVDPPDGGWPIQ